MAGAITPIRGIVRAEPSPETPSERMGRLQAERREIATEQIAALALKLEELTTLSAEIEAGGEAYAPGVRAIASTIARDCESRRLTLAQITGRNPS